MPSVAAPVRFHLSLNVSDLAKAVDFIEKLLGTPPAKRRDDYAKFELDSPPLVLSLEPRSPQSYGSLNHVGFRFSDAAALIDAQARLESAGIQTQREEGVECCYAKQSKFWVHDLDHRLWEFYILEGDIDHRGAGQPLEKMVGAEAARHVVRREPRIWEHRMADPSRVSGEDFDEIRLRGTFNVPVTPQEIRRRLREAFAALRPGGKLHLHHLTADEPVSEADLSLPGRAASVKHVPVREELLREVQEAGFTEITLTKFGTNPCFEAASVELRETMIEARRPAHGSDILHTVVYKGPFAQVQDDRGNTFHRGERVTITDSQWEALELAGLAEQFTLMSPRGTPVAACGTVAGT